MLCKEDHRRIIFAEWLNKSNRPNWPAACRAESLIWTQSFDDDDSVVKVTVQPPDALDGHEAWNAAPKSPPGKTCSTRPCRNCVAIPANSACSKRIRSWGPRQRELQAPYEEMHGGDQTSRAGAITTADVPHISLVHPNHQRLSLSDHVDTDLLRQHTTADVSIR